ncbi:YtxH domain-containing protein [Enterococcus sp. AZ109]|uniref:YtxH domain-containing protein n=1 Tax=Enterococcus sp. AZ109 TaxID=2774634 RepID=UPI003F258651
MKRNSLDITVLVLGIVCIGLMTMNRYILSPIWNSEIRTEMTMVKAGMNDVNQEITETLKDNTKELAKQNLPVKNMLKQAPAESHMESNNPSYELKSSF